ncbi:hypothetical protein BTO00_08745 [Vibrio campbellii]|uniref:hypothetical protein n=1 Tax=Vibrio campbellii TaxID=680 RepID=UPI000CF36FAD|nr:hypothetical protein [Vibrio campbellii]PQJ46180.1 hypothetical protein BTO00_08745 [Vibrio campbellii]
MGTVIGLLILAGIDFLLKGKTGLHLHQWIAKKSKTLRRANKLTSSKCRTHHFNVFDFVSAGINKYSDLKREQRLIFQNSKKTLCF